MRASLTVRALEIGTLSELIGVTIANEQGGAKKKFWKRERTTPASGGQGYHRDFGLSQPDAVFMRRLAHLLISSTTQHLLLLRLHDRKSIISELGGYRAGRQTRTERVEITSWNVGSGGESAGSSGTGADAYLASRSAYPHFSCFLPVQSSVSPSFVARFCRRLPGLELWSPGGGIAQGVTRKLRGW